MSVAYGGFGKRREPVRLTLEAGEFDGGSRSSSGCVGDHGSWACHRLRTATALGGRPSMRIRVTHTVDQLDRDMRAIPARAATQIATVVKRNVGVGTNRAQGFAKKKSGPHGGSFYKRITGEMTGAWEGEFGITEGSGRAPVGGGFRNGGPNRDLERAADIIGPKLEKDVGKVMDRLFRGW